MDTFKPLLAQVGSKTEISIFSCLPWGYWHLPPGSFSFGDHTFTAFGLRHDVSIHVQLGMYSQFQKKCTFNSEFFVASPRGATKKIGIKCAFLLE